MAGATRRAAVSWLLALVPLTVWGTSDSENIIWPAHLSDFELWQEMSVLEPAITGNVLRVSELAIRMVDMGDQHFATANKYWKSSGYTECKCRLECLSSRHCVAFKTKHSRCELFDARGTDLKPAPADTNMQFKMLNAAVGDVCQIDLECSRHTSGAFCAGNATSSATNAASSATNATSSATNAASSATNATSSATDATSSATNATSSGNSSTCQCPGDFVANNGACVDPMTLTTTTTTTTTEATTTVVATTTAEPTDAPTTTSPTTATPMAAVTVGTVNLETMLKEVEWPCDEDNEFEACSFLEGFAGVSAPAMWKATVAGLCDTGKNRCKFPAVLSTDTGAPRIEAWRSAGWFKFSLGEFPSPPPDISGQFNPGTTAPNTAWTYDCTTTDGTSMLMTGMLGIARNDKIDKNVPRDMDLILCTRFTTTSLQVDPTDGEVLDISGIGQASCPSNYVVTGVWSGDENFAEPLKAKCSRLTRGTVNEGACVPTPRHIASTTAIYWNACAQEGGPFVLTGFELMQSVNAEVKEWRLRCCPATGQVTTTNMAS